MTSPLLATLGLSMMIPLSVLSDCARGLANLTPGFFVGSSAVFVGFQLENWAESRERTGAQEPPPQEMGCLLQTPASRGTVSSMESLMDSESLAGRFASRLSSAAGSMGLPTPRWCERCAHSTVPTTEL